MEFAVFAGGCFWCTEAVFKMLQGVISVEPGYTGGKTDEPTYDEVSLGGTGHAESVRVEFDPNIISFSDLLTVFFGSHDPTTLNKQGGDIGTQYRSAIFYTSDEQKNEATLFIKKLNDSNKFGNPIVTEVVPFDTFYPAENYHKNFYETNKHSAYCELIINPKLEKVQKEFATLLKNKSK